MARNCSWTSRVINQRDYPVVQGIVVIISSLIVMISVGIDIAIAYIDQVLAIEYLPVFQLDCPKYET